MSRTVALPAARHDWGRASEWGLYHATRGRKYLNRAERRRALLAMETLPLHRALYCLVVAWSGARPSEVLNLTRADIDVESSVLSIVTLKAKTFRVREVPLPPWLVKRLERFFSLKNVREDELYLPLWSFSRSTAWRTMRAVMEAAGLVGVKACSRGRRHAFGVCTLTSDVPLHIILRWLGHARLSTTAIYASAIGPEEMIFARRFWAANAPKRVSGGLCAA